MKAPTEVETERFLLRKPEAGDIESIYRSYAGDAAVGQYLAWPIHTSTEDTRAFLEFSDAEWRRWPAGPFLILSRTNGELLGSTGLAFETPHRASTGYVIKKAAWGNGFATEATEAMKVIAKKVGVWRLFAHCHPQHGASINVLDKCGFLFEGTLRAHSEFPNLAPGIPLDVALYSWLSSSA